MELVRSRSYDLDQLAHVLLAIDRPVLSSDIVGSFKSGGELLKLINWAWSDPLIVIRVIAVLNALPLFMQITQIAGGVLSRTLLGGRAERNEYLLLHAFHRAGYVPPDKPMPRKPGKNLDANSANEGDPTPARKKAQYAGGLVLEPVKGLYDSMILLLDFNSLYPSIIQEYNICFTTVDQSHRSEMDEIPNIPESGIPEGILPREIRKLVELRREVKKLMKLPGLSSTKREQYEIRQMGLKLTANSMYGCLGFTNCRFYAKPLAALITAKGREILTHTKELVERMGYQVIYGDTDSIMIDTKLYDVVEAKKRGLEIKKQVNKCHRHLELDVDGLYKRLLLLKKKKYAGLSVDLDDPSGQRVKREMKGIDVVRRDWSQLAKDAGNAVIDRILESMNRDELVEQIVDLLENLRREIDANTVPIEKFDILKQLTRNPAEYADVKNQPHAAVALRLNATGKWHLRHGDIVHYIICQDGTGGSAMQRAYHRSELVANPALQLDVQYYLAHQIHPVVSRLCDPIDEIDAVRIAQALGLDPTGYRRSLAQRVAEDARTDQYVFGVIADYGHCDSFTVDCAHCQATVWIRRAFEGQGLDIHFALEKCSQCGKSLQLSSAFLVNKLRTMMNDAIVKYSMNLVVCEDVACAFRSRRASLQFTRDGVQCPRCHSGLLKREYSSKALFDQQSFFRSIFDYPAAIRQCTIEQTKRLQTSNDRVHFTQLYADLLGVCDEFLAANAYNMVDLAFLFAPMIR